jgi:hypothetical protein
MYEDWCELPPSSPIVEQPGRRPSAIYDMARAFLKRQWGLSTRDAEQWGLRYCVRGYHAWRIIIPITMHATVVGFQARSFRGGEPKYVTSKYGLRGEPFAECGRPAEALLFNIDAVQEGDDVILVEGAGDAMALDRNTSRRRPGAEDSEAGCTAGSPDLSAEGPTGTSSSGQSSERPVPVALLGLALTEEKAALFAAKQPGRVIIATDAEADAQRRGREMAQMLRAWNNIDVAIGQWVGGKDAGAGAQLQLVGGLRGLSALVHARMHH